jgi:choline dehydrogenase-like flavoprotein
MSAPTPVRPPTDRNSGDVSFDVVVFGGRCAGAATALLLARAGLRVLVADRSAEGSDTLSGHMIKPDGVGRLGAWGSCPTSSPVAVSRSPAPSSCSTAVSNLVRNRCPARCPRWRRGAPCWTG